MSDVTQQQLDEEIPLHMNITPESQQEAAKVHGDILIVNIGYLLHDPQVTAKINGVERVIVNPNYTQKFEIGMVEDKTKSRGPDKNSSRFFPITGGHQQIPFAYRYLEAGHEPYIRVRKGVGKFLLGRYGQTSRATGRQNLRVDSGLRLWTTDVKKQIEDAFEATKKSKGRPKKEE